MPQVKAVTQMGSAPWTDNVNLTLYTRSQEEGEPTFTAYWNNVGYDFFSTLDIPLVAGRVFERDRNDMPPQGETDLTTPRNIVIDRAYAQQLGFATPQDAIDVLVYEPSQFGPSRPAQIIGVVESRPLYLRGLGATANAYGLGDGAGMQNQIVRLAANDVANGLAAIEQTWQDLGARVPMQRRFMDEMFEENYRNFARINVAFATLAVFAIAISLIGLFGMAVQTVSRRLHEIGVRKSLGAENFSLFALLLYDFSKPVLIANLLAWPLAYFAAQAYLSIFIQRVELTPLPFLLSLVLVLAVAWLAVASQALRAARIKPAMVLRFE
jgi:putative ABC transport system permease protein